MTRTIPLRRTTLQFSQIRRTLLRTFMTQNLSNPVPTGESISLAEEFFFLNPQHILDSKLRSKTALATTN
jgi:hypothetical protein